MKRTLIKAETEIEELEQLSGVLDTLQEISTNVDSLFKMSMQVDSILKRQRYETERLVSEGKLLQKEIEKNEHILNDLTNRISRKSPKSKGDKLK